MSAAVDWLACSRLADGAVAQHLPGLYADDHGQMRTALTGGDTGDIVDPRQRPVPGVNCRSSRFGASWVEPAAGVVRRKCPLILSWMCSSAINRASRLWPTE